jgi:gamma-glutamylcyclotransferase (GGCT)/AIG2-like uncharacterized protein YtfP
MTSAAEQMPRYSDYVRDVVSLPQWKGKAPSYNEWKATQPENKTMHRVFVYGTLKRGIHNHRLLAATTFVGKAITVSKFRMVAGGFPVLLRGEAGTTQKVCGEVYEVNDEQLARLDGLEGYTSRRCPHNMYNRRKISVQVWNEARIIDTRAFVYVGNEKRGVGSGWPAWTVTNSAGQLEWPRATS